MALLKGRKITQQKEYFPIDTYRINLPINFYFKGELSRGQVKSHQTNLLIRINHRKITDV
jgi:hypothetical protein